MREGTCREPTCKRAVIFVRNERTSQWHILDPEPDPNGNVIVSNDRAHVMTKVERTGFNWTDPLCTESVYIDHHATCPRPGGFRRSSRTPQSAKTDPSRAAVSSSESSQPNLWD